MHSYILTPFISKIFITVDCALHHPKDTGTSPDDAAPAG